MNIRSHNAHAATAIVVLMTVTLCGCQTAANAKPAKADRQARTERPAKARPAETSSITFSSEADMLLALLRQAGPMVSSGGVVLMNGLGDQVVPPQEFKNLGASAFAERLAKAGTLEIAQEPGYGFLYAKGYEALASAKFPIGGALATREASAVFGEGTKLYNALAILSQNLGVTIVADNVVAEITAGEMAVRDAPLSEIIEALLRGARATPDAVRVESTDDYIFLRASANPAPPDNLLNDAELTPAERAALDAKVSVILPPSARREGAAVFVGAAMPLGDVLESLGKQLGIPVSAAPELSGLPVNYTVLNDVSARTALNLIVRQWPVAKFGFVYRGGQVTLQTR